MLRSKRDTFALFGTVFTAQSAMKQNADLNMRLYSYTYNTG